MNITIRPMQQSDESQVAAFLSQIMQVHHAIRPDIFRSNYKQEQSITNNDSSAPIFVAMDEHGNIMGCLWCVINQERENSLKIDRDWLIIDDICVDEQFRRKGIGRQLVDFACRFAKENLLNRIELNVYNDNLDAVRFYEKIGFTTQKRVMELDLQKQNKEDANCLM